MLFVFCYLIMQNSSTISGCYCVTFRVLVARNASEHYTNYGAIQARNRIVINLKWWRQMKWIVKFCG